MRGVDPALSTRGTRFHLIDIPRSVLFSLFPFVISLREKCPSRPAPHTGALPQPPTNATILSVARSPFSPRRLVPSLGPRSPKRPLGRASSTGIVPFILLHFRIIYTQSVTFNSLCCASSPSGVPRSAWFKTCTSCWSRRKTSRRFALVGKPGNGLPDEYANDPLS